MQNSPEGAPTATSTTQKHLGNKGLIVLLGLLSAFIPLSIDIYLPALPTLATHFQAPQSMVNMTLTLFFVFYGLGTLLWGPLSDKYGRKFTLLAGMTIYTAAGLLCAFSFNIYILLIARALQAAGGGAATAISTAIAKDVYSGRKQESVLAIVQAMVVISPAIAPMFGAFILRFTSWEGVFVAQAVIGVVTTIGVIAFQETLSERNPNSILHTLGRLSVVLKNRRFTTLLMIFSVMNITSMTFVTAASYIYQGWFGLSSEVFSYYFAFNAIGMLFGPLIYIRLTANIPRNTIITGGFALMILFGLAVCMAGEHAPWLLAILMVPPMLAISGLRPGGTYLMLEQQKSDAGSMSGLIGAFGLIMGSLGIVVVSFDWASQIVVVGAASAGVGLVCICAWLLVSRQLTQSQESSI